MIAEMLAFIEERIADDETTARTAITASGGAVWEATDGGIYPADNPSHHPGPFLADGYGFTDPDYGNHIGRHDPTRVLREVAAKRRLLARHQPVAGLRQAAPVDCSTCLDDACGTDHGVLCSPLPWPCPEVRDLAAVWSDHPDYNEAWRP